jgi:glycosyltransferase involved in cell wall biosynthesis
VNAHSSPAPVAIIIPCYNASAFIRETIDSTLRQSLMPAEVIVVDDGSTDGSAAIAESYGSPVRVIRQHNQGESIAMNAAIAVARADYIVILGADDVLHPYLIESQWSAIRDVPKGVACTGFAFFMESTSRPFGETMPSADSFFPGIISANLAPASCWMVPKESILQAGCFYAPQQYFEDWDLWWRVGLTGATLVRVPMVGFYYRQHANSQLATLASAERAYGHAWVMERMCRAMLDRPDLLNRHGAPLFWSALTALRASRACGVPWSRLIHLSHMITAVADRQPPDLNVSAFARLVRTVGTERAETLRAMFSKAQAAPVYRAPWLQNGRPLQATDPVAR